METSFLAMGQSTQVPQRQLPSMLGAMPMPSMVEPQWLASCESLLQAIHLCIHLSKLPHYAIAERLGIDKGHWTRMMQAQAHFPTNKLTELMSLCGNYAPMQWLAGATGFQLYEDPKAKREAELLAELASIRAGRGPSTNSNSQGALAKAA
jgi:hypothetical protein